jgi:FAD/FMN-containing dehydrogenase
LDNIKEALAGITGPEKIDDNPTVLETYAEDHSFLRGICPMLAVYPQNKTEVIEIIRWANRTKTPLVPVSSGGPRFNGDTIPIKSSIIMDLRKMNRILKIDEVNRCVMIEPGVTFSQLLPEMHRNGLRLNMPLLPRGTKSVMTSYLEREPPIIPKYQFDYIDPLLTLEVIFGTGDELRTGSASGPGDLSHLKSDMVNPWGPGSIDYHRFFSGAQGTMGIVTWAMIKAEVRPAIEKTFYIPCPESGSAAALMADLLKKRIVDECLCLDNVSLSAILSDSNAPVCKALKEGLPPCTVIARVAGYKRRAEERVSIQEKYLADICKDHGLKISLELPEAKGKEKNFSQRLTGETVDSTSWKIRSGKACPGIFFLSPLSSAGKYPQVMRDVVSGDSRVLNNIGFYIQPLVQGRGCHLEFTLFHDDEYLNKDTAKKLFNELSAAFIKAGAYFSRPYPQWAESVYKQNPKNTEVLKKIKNIFDPQHILNPGKLCFQEISND